MIEPSSLLSSRALDSLSLLVGVLEVLMFAKKTNTPVVDTDSLTATSPELIAAQAASIQNPDGLVVIGKSTHVSGKIGACRVLDVYGILEADVVTEMLIVREVSF